MSKKNKRKKVILIKVNFRNQKERKTFEQKKEIGRRKEKTRI